jgi:hypothetical protein
MRKLALLIALSSLCSIVLAGPAVAAPAYIDRTRRIIEVPAECLTTPGWLNNLPAYTGGGLNLTNVDGRFVMVLSTTGRLLTRRSTTARDFAWYHFAPNDANYNRSLTPAQRLVRAYTMMRCGLPVTPGDSLLYNPPPDAASQAAFVRFAMGHGGGETRAPTGYTLVGNGEREALLMYAAEAIKFDLTHTVVDRDHICIRYTRTDHQPGCANEIAANAADALTGYLYEGINRISYTGHEFWMMFNLDAYRNKVYFTRGDHELMSDDAPHVVDQFLVWDAATSTLGLWHDGAGDHAALPTNPYRFQLWADPTTHHAHFFQTVLPTYVRNRGPRILIDAPY